MIAVIGEALVDLVIDPTGGVTAALGGAPFNAARACGRLGADVAFVGALSNDRFGSILRARLVDDGVDVTRSLVVDEPTTLAAAELDDRGSATYRFYVDGTSAPRLGPVDLRFDPAGPSTDVVLTGGLALALEPIAGSVVSMVESLTESTLVVVDVNCRPLVVADRAAYLRRVDSVLARAHVVKVSDEDLEYLDPGAAVVDAARRLVPTGRPGVVLVTGGAAGVHVVTHDDVVVVPIAPVEVVDTIGAGDTFSGAFVSWWWSHGFGVAESADVTLVERAVTAASVAAGIACTRRGAEPPYRRELPPDWAD
ncbi:MAG: hypothetical protein RLZZ01_1589 [Actinomycetota bacterium]